MIPWMFWYEATDDLWPECWPLVWEWPRKPLTHDLAYPLYPSYPPYPLYPSYPLYPQYHSVPNPPHPWTKHTLPPPSPAFKWQSCIQRPDSPPTFCHCYKEERRDLNDQAETPRLDRKTQVLTNEPTMKWCLACNCARPFSDSYHIFSLAPHNHKAIELPNPHCVVTMLWLTPSRPYWRSPYKAGMEVKFKPQTLCNPRKACGRAPHLFLST